MRYPAEMAAPLRWTIRLLIAIVGAALLTWREWEEHHPPEIALIALIHFAFMLIVIAIVICIGRWFSRRHNAAGHHR